MAFTMPKGWKDPFAPAKPLPYLRNNYTVPGLTAQNVAAPPATNSVAAPAGTVPGLAAVKPKVVNPFDPNRQFKGANADYFSDIAGWRKLNPGWSAPGTLDLTYRTPEQIAADTARLTTKNAAGQTVMTWDNATQAEKAAYDASRAQQTVPGLTEPMIGGKTGNPYLQSGQLDLSVRNDMVSEYKRLSDLILNERASAEDIKRFNGLKTFLKDSGDAWVKNNNATETDVQAQVQENDAAMHKARLAEERARLESMDSRVPGLKPPVYDDTGVTYADGSRKDYTETANQNAVNDKLFPIIDKQTGTYVNLQTDEGTAAIKAKVQTPADPPVVPGITPQNVVAGGPDSMQQLLARLGITGPTSGSAIRRRMRQMGIS